jgi:hypothetical protein
MGETENRGKRQDDIYRAFSNTLNHSKTIGINQTHSIIIQIAR